MFKKKTIRIFSIVAIALSSLGLLFSIVGTLFIKDSPTTFAFFFGVLSWAILLWASIIGYKLCSSYQLYDDEYKKVGIRIYLIIVAFILFFFIGLIIGLALSIILLATLWGLKRNYDEWDYSDTITNDMATMQNTNTNETIDIS